MERLAVIVLDGLVFASYLFLVSAGLTFIYGVMRILNVAHGSLYGLGAYVGAWLVLRLWPGGSGSLPPVLTYLMLLVGAIFVGIAVGPLLERVIGGNLRAFGIFIGAVCAMVLFRADLLPGWLAILGLVAVTALGALIGRYLERNLQHRVAPQSEITSLILTFALFLMFEDIMKLIFGVDPLLPSLPSEQLGAISLAGITYERYKVLQLSVAIVSALALWFIVNRTTFGKLIISVIADREVSAAMGINVPRIFTAAFVIGAIMAAVGGAFIAPTISVVPGIAVEVIILAFAVTTIGGLGSVPGAAIGSLLTGLLRSAAVHSPWPELDLFVVYALMTLILLIKPQGLFGGVQARRI